MYICDQQPVTVLPACPHQDQVSGIPYTLSLDHPDKLMDVGSPVISHSVKPLLNRVGEGATILQICTYMHVRYLRIFYIRTYKTSVQCIQ